MNEPLKHHYIPQFILRNFCNENNLVWYWDNNKKYLSERNTKSVFMNELMYKRDDVSDEVSFEVENNLAKFEQEISILIKDKILNKTDIALLVIGENSPSPHDLKILELIKAKQIPYAVVYNKSDRHPNRRLTLQPGIAVSATTGDGIQELKELLPGLLPKPAEKPLISDLVKSGDVVILVTPIDGSAPKGRLILPQQQVLRDALDSKCICVVVQESELPTAIQKFSPDVALVVTDSQIFKSVDAVVPSEIRLTSFSILMARYKGNLKQAIASAKALNQLQPCAPLALSLLQPP